ncbi:MAG: hypothetical protein AAFU65_03575, partial [Pseudomonadota bacterium]
NDRDRMPPPRRRALSRQAGRHCAHPEPGLKLIRIGVVPWRSVVRKALILQKMPKNVTPVTSRPWSSM